jgi:hypothetical protein
MSVEIANSEYTGIPIEITRRRARHFDIQIRENEIITRNMPYISQNARNLIEYYLTSETIAETSFKRKHCIGSVVVENNSTDKCECNICYEDYEKHCFVKLNCGHEFCGKCVKNSLEKTGYDKKARCAYCRTDITNIEFSSEEKKTEFSDILT